MGELSDSICEVENEEFEISVDSELYEHSDTECNGIEIDAHLQDDVTMCLSYPVPVPNDPIMIISAALIINVLEKNVSIAAFDSMMSLLMVSFDFSLQCIISRPALSEAEAKSLSTDWYV